MPRGRPKKEIDKTQFEKLCGLQCTAEEKFVIMNYFSPISLAIRSKTNWFKLFPWFLAKF